ncbi:MAG: MCE family protein [Nocardiaceae bacterium]|nr:MCE family protein [Nocardiaceae bacterium]
MLIDPSGRGPTMRQLYVAGIAMFLVIAVALTLLMLRYVGFFDKYVPVNAIMKTTGDGLMPKADVKYKGVLVGEVDSVKSTEGGATQDVTIHLKPQFADSIPANVTARTVPSNVFAVNSIEFLAPETASAKTIASGDQIAQDTSVETTALQSTLTDVRTLLKAIQPERLGRILNAVAGGLDPQGRVPGSTLERLNRVLKAVDDGTPTGQDLLARTSAGMAALNESMPELVDALAASVTTNLTLIEKQAQFENLLVAGVFTMDSTHDLFARNPDLGKVLVQSTAVVFDNLSADQGAMNASIPELDKSLIGIVGAFKKSGPWAPQPYLTQVANISFTPFRPYVRADCPRYGDMEGPSCYTAPVHGDPGYLPENMYPHSLGHNEDAAAKGNVNDAGPLAPFLPPKGDSHGAPAPAAPKAPAGKNPPPFPWMAPPAPGTKPASFTPASFTGAAAMEALLGRAPSPLEYVLLGTALQGGYVTFSPAEGAV